ncbi:Helix-turn-helix domain-containing protein [Paenibacillus algorifonticola]|uniref:Helix-turn-helix domain-containing protein n=1 Tax=Paenibacillus algorifonticola TaxID=684063 RepID=A0A1I2AY30_9BACL|nr:response regulator [Paenibacillus algorifonticola]SFE48548.1 Helix-turn-helix domain-containing protein [Paenibacillus algorifonticola]
MAQANVIKVVIAEDEDIIRGTLVRKLEGLDQAIQIVGSAQDGKEALELVNREQPDLLITDIRMPVMDGIELIQSIHRYYPRMRKIITSGFADFEYARQAIQFNVIEYLLKPIATTELARVYNRVKTLIEAERTDFKTQMKSLQPSGADTEELVQMVQGFMREHYSEDLSLEQIARSFNFTASYLSKIFIKHTEEPPSRYLMSLRINEAKYLLRNHSHLSVKEVGEQVGYSDQFYFSRIFKQMTGFTPKEFQK